MQPAASPIKLRDYQERAVNQVRDAYRSGKRAVLLVLPTGAGKTVIFSYITQTTTAREKRTLILVHRIELVRQTSAALRGFGVKHGIIAPGFTPDIIAPVQVGMVQTVANRAERMFREWLPDLVVIDEAHHAAAGTWKKVVEDHVLKVNPKSLLLGVTATPIRTDGKGLGKSAGGLFDSLIVGPQVAELTSMGFLVPTEIYVPREVIDFSEAKLKGDDYDPQSLADIMEKTSITGDALANYLRYCKGLPAICFCPTVKFAERLAEQFRAAGVAAYSVDGSMDDALRRRILGGLGQTVEVVMSCDLVSEGTDIPAVACAIFLRKTKSEGLYLQQAGRALRPFQGKRFSYIFDHVGNVLEHGTPDEPREWSLAGQDKKKKKRKRDDEDTPPRSRSCPSCMRTHRMLPQCPHCGHRYDPEHRNQPNIREGELAKINEQQLASVRRPGRRRDEEVSNARTREQLEAIRKARNYKPEWVDHILRSREQRMQQRYQAR